MNELSRCVRFSINPFLAEDEDGFNSFASKPRGEGLAFFFELCVSLAGEVEPATGFIVNVVDIDKCVRRYVVPIFAERIRSDFRRGKHIGFLETGELLTSAAEELTKKFGGAKLSGLSLKLNPFRKISVSSKGTAEDKKMMYFSEKFEFAAMHKLWNDEFSAERNFEVFGKCANKEGHGHNYLLEVTVKLSESDGDFRVGEFERIVDTELIKLIDHKNLNVDIAEFGRMNPTVENIAIFAWGKIAGKFDKMELTYVTVWETDKTCCSYYGEQS